MPFAEAMSRFGSDKPDTRYGLELTDVNELVRAHAADFGPFEKLVRESPRGSFVALNAKGQ